MPDLSIWTSMFVRSFDMSKRLPRSAPALALTTTYRSLTTPPVIVHPKYKAHPDSDLIVSKHSQTFLYQKLVAICGVESADFNVQRVPSITRLTA